MNEFDPDELEYCEKCNELLDDDGNCPNCDDEPLECKCPGEREAGPCHCPACMEGYR